MTSKTENIFGLHAVRHAMEKQPDGVLELWIQKNKKQSTELNKILELAEQINANIKYVSSHTLDKLSGNELHQGVVLKRFTENFADIKDIDTLLVHVKQSVPLILVLDGLQDPHNLGACLRTVNAVGGDGIIIPKDRAASVTSTVRKVACGAAEYTPVITVTNITRSLAKLKQAGIWIIGTTSSAKENIYDMDLTVPVALVIGSEAKGLRKNTQTHCDWLVSIPMYGHVESLNASIAAALCLYEAVRQRM